MTIEYVRYRVPNDQVEAFVAAYREAQHALAASPHCLRYELARCTEEPVLFVLRIEWDSLTGHLEGFRGSEAFQPFLSLVRPFVAMIEEMQHYEVTDVASVSSV